MILERAIFSIKPSTAKDFITAFAKARPYIESAAGFSQLEMRQGIENPDSFLLLVWWGSVDDHMKGFRESQAFVERRKHLGPFFASPPAVGALRRDIVGLPSRNIDIPALYELN